MRSALIVALILSLSVAFFGCGGDRVGPEVMKKLEGATVVGMDSNFMTSDSILLKSKAGCQWRIYTPNSKNNLYVEPVDDACAN